MMTPMRPKFSFAVIPAIFLNVATATTSLKADAIVLNGHNEEYWGKVIRLSNDGIRFRVECTGKILDLKWKAIHDPVVYFTPGCRRVEIIQWGGSGPPDCRQTGAEPPFRLFEYGNVANEDYFFHIDYDDKQGILTVENTLKITAQNLRTGQFSLWMVCDVKP